MRTTQEPDRSSSEPKDLRFWPGVAAVSVQWLCWVALPLAVPGPVTGFVAVIGGLSGGLAVAVWWAFLSRAPRLERVGVIALAAAALFVTSRLVDESIASGMMGMLLAVYAVPVASLAIVAAAAGTLRLAAGARRTAMAAAILLSCGAWTLLRSDGITGSGAAEFSWRWTKTAEQRFLEGIGDEPGPRLAIQPATLGQKRLARFPRAPSRTASFGASGSKPTGTRRRQSCCGAGRSVPGASSFAVGNGLLYTQEQLGDDEAVTCYALATGELVWMHRDKARFSDSHAGPGPRATPALSEDRVYAFGATGTLNALDASDGTVLWSRNAASDTGTTVPDWGFAGSPLAVGDLVVVAVSGTLAAYDRVTGEPRWFGPPGGGSYSSPHSQTIDGAAQFPAHEQLGPDERRSARRQGAMGARVAGWRPHRPAGCGRGGRPAGPGG